MAVMYASLTKRGTKQAEKMLREKCVKIYIKYDIIFRENSDCAAVKGGMHKLVRSNDCDKELIMHKIAQRRKI